MAVFMFFFSNSLFIIRFECVYQGRINYIMFQKTCVINLLMIKLKILIRRRDFRPQWQLIFATRL